MRAREALDALAEASAPALRHTLPVQTLVYLATLAAPIPCGVDAARAAAAAAAGLPARWIPLLEMPVGVSRARQRQSVAARMFAAFAPLATQVALLRNGRGVAAADAPRPGG